MITPKLHGESEKELKWRRKKDFEAKNLIIYLSVIKNMSSIKTVL